MEQPPKPTDDNTTAAENDRPRRGPFARFLDTVEWLGNLLPHPVTLFALILSLGLLVDDPITGVENIARYLSMGVLRPRDAVLKAIQEVQPALILSTLAIIASFLPLMFITGMMGPYMAPMALNVPLTVEVGMGSNWDEAH